MNAISAPTRPVLRWHGGKWLLAPWIIGHFPAHRIYVEPFGGAFSVGLRKPRVHAEVYNDLDDEVVNLFRVLRDETTAAELIRQLALTPFARTEFEESYRQPLDNVDRARRLIARSFMGQGSVSNAIGSGATGFRSNTCRSEASPNSSIPAHDWAGYPAALASAIDRLRGVVIERRDATSLMSQHDRPETLFYVDPPYLPETRSKVGKRKGSGFVAYASELKPDDHVALLDFLDRLTGMVVLSGYPSALYDDRLKGWRRVEKEALADGARPRTEVLWINPQCSEALDREADAKQMPLFEGART